MTVSLWVRFVEAHPFLRLLFPLISGIVLADIGDGYRSVPLVYPLLFCGLMGSAMLMASVSTSWRMRAFYGIFTSLFYLGIGWGICSLKWRNVVNEWPSDATLYEAVVVDETSRKSRSRLCPVELLSQRRDDKKFLEGYPKTKLLLYLPDDSASSSLQPGDVLLFSGKIQQPQQFSTEFDYPRYLYHHGVSGTLYTRAWQKTDSSLKALKYVAWKWRNKLLDYYRKTGLTDESLAIYGALTLGYKEELSDEVRQLFEVSGASHVLALSGLHIGILCGVLVGLFGLFFRGSRAMRWCRLLSLPIIWAYVLLVGAPVSVVRSAVMFSCLVIGSCFTRVGYPVNTLCLTAFGMLIYNPFYLFDVGFQLSFSAVASLLLLQPRFQEMLPRFSNPVVRYLGKITTVSLAAQIGVIPLILYYFSRFSPYALLVNLWLIPLVGLLVMSAVPFFVLALLPVDVIQCLFADGIHGCIAVMNEGLAVFSRLPWADIDGLSISLFEVLLLYVLFVFCFYGWFQRCRRALIGILALLCIGVFIRLFAYL